MIIYTFDDFLNRDDLVKYQNYAINSKICQNIIKDNTFALDFWEKYGKKLNENVKKDNLYFEGVYPEVTISNSSKPIIKHCDKKMHSERFKILIYLNTVIHGGTIFYEEEKGSCLINNKVNRLVLFDIRLPHESENFSGHDDKKMAIGFRLI